MQALQDRLALVTGASAGIGAAAARQLTARGARVVLAARRGDRLAILSAELPGSRIVEVDVRDADAMQRAFGGECFDIVLANAGLGLGLGPLQEGAPENWSNMIDTNVKGLLHTVRATAPAMIERGAGDLVLIGSVAGRSVYPGGNVYCSTKHAVRAIYEAMRIDMAGKGVRITTVDPGMVDTEFSTVRFGGDEAKAARVYEGMTPLHAEDVADAVLYAVTRPAHVNIGEIVLWPTDQASVTSVRRDA